MYPVDVTCSVTIYYITMINKESLFGAENNVRSIDLPFIIGPKGR